MAEKCVINIEENSYSPTVETDDYVNIVDTNNTVIIQQVTEHHIRSYDCIESISTDFSKCNLMKCIKDSAENEDENDVVQIKENQENNNDKTEEESEELEVDENGNDDHMSEIQKDSHEYHLETPVENNALTSGQMVDKTNIVKPKRLSDEFFSAEEEDEDLNNRKIELIERNKTIDVVVSTIRIQKNLHKHNKSVEKAACSSSNQYELEDAQNIIDIDSNPNEDDVNTSTVTSVVNGFLGEDTTSSCGLMEINNAIVLTSEDIPNVVQSLDAIECEDYKNELKLTNGILIRNSSLISDKNRLNLDLVNTFKENEKNSSKKVRSEDDLRASNFDKLCDESGEKTNSKSKSDLTTTPTSSRIFNNCRGSGFGKKSATKLNLDIFENREQENNDNEVAEAPTSSSSAAGLTQCTGIKIASKLDSFLSTNSNDSLSSDKSYIISNMRTSLNFNNDDEPLVNNGASSSKGFNECNLKKNEKSKLSPESCDIEDKDEIKDNTENVLPSTSSSSSSIFNPSYNCQFSEYKRTAANSYDEPDKNVKSENNADEFPSASSNFASNVNEVPISSSSSSTTSLSNRNSNPSTVAIASVGRLLKNELRKCPKNFVTNEENQLINAMGMALSHMEAEHECDEEWADCEEGSDNEEICTCIDYSYDYGLASSEDELPSRDVDLSVYTPHMDTISDDMLQENNACTADTPRLHRKRKLTESRILFGDSSISESMNSLNSNRKRLALENSSSSPRSLLTPSILNLSVTTTPTSVNTLGERRTPRSIIPTKDNPPPELNEWLIQFQRWSHAERLLAVDRLIDHCEPTQVRHMMKVIEPQFQRDFISLLPKELALQVLSFLEPKDLLRAAQTCRSWRFLADDNLLWKEKCKVAGIIMETTSDKPKRGRAGNMPPISSAWKAAYIRQHTIEMNWRSRPVRKPKTLKGHDDHVITCLQFCGNRIVSGSDDNTLKVWSAITGKCLRTLVGHTGGVWSSQMSGNVIISGSTDRTLKVWSADTGQCVHTLYGHTSTVRCMHLHGNKVVSGSRDATLRVWDVNEGTCLHVLVGHLAAVRCVQYDGKLVVSGAYDYMVKVWNPERQECLHTLQGHTNRVYSLQFDGVHVVSGSLDTSIRVWEAETGSCKHTLMGHQSLTSGMELRQNILVSGNADSTVKVWDIITGQCLQTLSGPNKHQSAVTCLQFNTRFVITSSDDGTVKLWDVKTGDFIRNMVALDSGGSGGVVWRIRANDTKLICAVGSRNGTEETKLMVLDFDVEGACLKCS